MNAETRAKLMRAAIEVCKRGIAAGQSPFGAAIASPGGDVVYAGHNQVRLNTDPCAHAEVVAIRGACELLQTIDLSGHVMATTCEPCPMCASAIHWARLDAVCFGGTIEDADAAGFNELHVPIRGLYAQGGSGVQVVEGVLRDECKTLFELWEKGPNPTPY